MLDFGYMMSCFCVFFVCSSCTVCLHDPQLRSHVCAHIVTRNQSRVHRSFWWSELLLSLRHPLRRSTT